jgi:hypothetical protein
VDRTGVGDRALAALAVRDVLGRHDPQKARQLLGPAALPVANLGAQAGGRQGVDAPEAEQRGPENAADLGRAERRGMRTQDLNDPVTYGGVRAASAGGGVAVPWCSDGPWP